MTWPTSRTTHQVAVVDGRARVWAVRHTTTGIRHDLIADTPLTEKENR